MKMKVKCVCCSYTKWLDEEHCGEMPFCDKCFSPMTAQEVITKESKKKKAK
ncbi:hypothetical protein LCGC14_2687110 [marine sediment metagenome]|uniref:Uncharacterized protein n=1 Tax=marine sediment metagenome TaxID=412755 RepID=A0A0F9A742_9ZZZZ